MAEIVADEAINCTVVDANTIAISTSELTQLLSVIDHYNLCLFDMPKNSGQDEIIMNVLNYDEFKWSEDNPLLPHLAGSSVVLQSHDDCYLYLESYDVALLQQVFELALQIYVGTVLIEETSVDEIEVGEVPSGLMKAVLSSDSALTILRWETEISESEVNRVREITTSADFRCIAFLSDWGTSRSLQAQRSKQKL